MTHDSHPGPVPTYWEYIHLDKLLTLQDGLERDGDVELVDEMHFIVIHQAIELVFKLMLAELRLARDSLSSDYVPDRIIPEVVKHLNRAGEALKVTINHFELMSMLQPLDFLAFRDKIQPSSGAQSFQMRTLEELLGLPTSERQKVLSRLRANLPDPNVANAFEAFILDPMGAILKQLDEQIAAKQGTPHSDKVDLWARAHINRTTADIEKHGTLRDSLEKWLYRTPICDSTPPNDSQENRSVLLEEDKKVVRGFVDDYIERGKNAGWKDTQVKDVQAFMRPDDDWETERVRASLLFIKMYPDLPLLAWPRTLLDKMIEMESLLVQFRNVHARMVERVIGNRPGTGGSPGIIYLDLTRDTRIFPELVQITGILIPKSQRWQFPGMDEFDFKAAGTSGWIADY